MKLRAAVCAGGLILDCAASQILAPADAVVLILVTFFFVKSSSSFSF